MYPLLFELGPLSIYSYGVLLATAYIVGLRFALRRADRAGLNGERVMDLGIFVIISALLGAKLMLLVVDFDQFTSDPSQLWVLLKSGGVFYGGLLLAGPRVATIFVLLMMAIGREHRWVGQQHIRSKTPLGPASQLKISGRASPNDQKLAISGPKCAHGTRLWQSAKSYNSLSIN